MIGHTLAQYRVTAAIGAGGMGEVWRATDTKLGRDVALKMLPEAFAADSDRLARPGRSTFQAGYSVSPDGRRFLVLLLDSRAIPRQINVVLNWFEELKARVSTR